MAASAGCMGSMQRKGTLAVSHTGVAANAEVHRAWR